MSEIPQESISIESIQLETVQAKPKAQKVLYVRTTPEIHTWMVLHGISASKLFNQAATIMMQTPR